MKTENQKYQSINEAILGVTNPDFIAEKKGDKAAYQKFFKGALKKFGVTEPDQLKGDKKKKFFDYVDANWKSDDEEKGVREEADEKEIAKGKESDKDDMKGKKDKKKSGKKTNVEVDPELDEEIYLYMGDDEDDDDEDETIEGLDESGRYNSAEYKQVDKTVTMARKKLDSLYQERKKLGAQAKDLIQSAKKSLSDKSGYLDPDEQSRIKKRIDKLEDYASKNFS